MAKAALLSMKWPVRTRPRRGEFCVRAKLIAGQFSPRRPTGRDIADVLAAGVLTGGTALGCTVGVLLSGIHAGAPAGRAFLFAGIFGRPPLRRWIRFYAAGRNRGR